MKKNYDKDGFEAVRFSEDNRIVIEGKTDAIRDLRTIRLDADVVIVGGGIAGVCASIAAAREGLQVVLVQDRPVLGGNASSEVRLWALGATSHMGNNNRWSRESGVIGEILEENLYRNPEGNPMIFDTVLLEKVSVEPNIRLLLNTTVYETEKDGCSRIKSCRAFCSINSTQYQLVAPYFIDSSGDGILSFQAGAGFRMGAENREEFGEKLAPKNDYGYLLGHSLYFYSKDTGRPVKYHPPAFALDDITKIPRFRSIQLKHFGCKLWWIEYGGRLDTVHASEEIKWELWKIIYGVWNYIKNSGEFPEAETHTLEWVGTIPGKRESRRFEGQYMIRQQDIVEQKTFPDAVAFGGWALDLHPADGVYSELPGCSQWHSKGVYQIPLRVSISRDIENLAYAGRIISASHVAFGSTRVMVTCGYIAQSTAQAVAWAHKNKVALQEVTAPANFKAFQQKLQSTGQHIPGVPFEDRDNLLKSAEWKASSCLKLSELKADGEWLSLNESAALLLPLGKGSIPSIKVSAKAEGKQNLTVQLRSSLRVDNFTPEKIIEELPLQLSAGDQSLEINFSHKPEQPGYYFITFLRNESIELRTSRQLLSGVLSVFNGCNAAVSNNGSQEGSAESGIDGFEFWTPRRRPAGGLIAFSSSSPLHTFSEDNLFNGYNRPHLLPNVWIADPHDPEPSLSFRWKEERSINKIVVNLDADFDHAMESVLMGHPEDVVPTCVRNFIVYDADNRKVAEVTDNHNARVVIELDDVIQTKALRFQWAHPSETTPAAVFSVSAYYCQNSATKKARE
jgi:hypothetical protein